MYKIGDKVETPIGIGIIKWIDKASKNDDEGFDTLYVSINGFPEIEVNERHIKPYRTAHEKLIELGYRISQTTALTHSLYTIYDKDGSSITIIERRSGNAYKTRQEVSLELSRILTQYLEELHETHTPL